jgi:hypothetical protein
VDQAAADMQAETQKPQNQKNNENCPKHINASGSVLCLGTSRLVLKFRVENSDAPRSTATLANAEPKV